MTIFRTSREIAASPEQVFAAFSDPERLAIWWGPSGFTNTFNACEFKAGGRWSFVMHGPDGANYPNENVFAEIEPSKAVVIRHVSEPRFRLTVAFERTAGGGTAVSWEQDFEDPDIARKIERIVVPANEQNLDRLSAEVVRAAGGG
jgi:uncharacterized protein YndB with AHSA1/START domain